MRRPAAAPRGPPEEGPQAGPGLEAGAARGRCISCKTKTRTFNADGQHACATKGKACGGVRKAGSGGARDGIRGQNGQFAKRTASRLVVSLPSLVGVRRRLAAKTPAARVNEAPADPDLAKPTAKQRSPTLRIPSPRRPLPALRTQSPRRPLPALRTPSPRRPLPASRTLRAATAAEPDLDAASCAAAVGVAAVSTAIEERAAWLREAAAPTSSRVAGALEQAAWVTLAAEFEGISGAEYKRIWTTLAGIWGCTALEKARCLMIMRVGCSSALPAEP